LKQKASGVKLMATDLDGTLLDSTHTLRDVTRSALKALSDRGVVMAVATGRARSSIHESVTSLEGLGYLISANGSKIYVCGTNELISERYLAPEAIDYIRPFFTDDEVLLEVFWDDVPHVEEKRFAVAREYGIPRWFSDYFFSTRKPLADFEDAVEANKTRVENINFIFASEAVQKRVHAFLSKQTGLYELTSSFPFNYEIGGVGVCKATAVDIIAKREGILQSETLCFGDNHNDVTMIEYAGIGVSTGNAVPPAQAAADLVTYDNNNDGVAAALKALGLA